ncbi:MAG: type I restriction enzyme HsdR N-terminal domain-containing protein [Deltaproteobacteria bacterium]|nr:type I restriction enzyme HsdR N-terminal domain-containing protein [Deltaproteobacteria bacterium]
MIDTHRPSLLDTIIKLRKRIYQIEHRQKSIGEENTKATLIEPLLSGLGWDVEELDEVVREYKRKPQDKPVDYALFLLRTPRLFVEAKALGQDLNNRKWVSQTLGYATVVGVEWCVLTNGDEYRLFNAHAAVDAEQKLFRTVRISDSSKQQYTVDTLDLLSKEKMGENLLNLLWKSHSVDREVKGVLDDMFSHEDSGLVRLICKRTTGLKPSQIRASLKRASISIDFPLSSATPAPGEQSNRRVGRRRKPKTSEARREAGRRAWETMRSRASGTLANLIRAGLIQPPLNLEKDYKGTHLEAVIQEDGKVLVDGRPYNSLSTAAGMARRSVVGAPPGRRYPQTDGWTFWRYRDPETGDLLKIDTLRQRYLRANP